MYLSLSLCAFQEKVTHREKKPSLGSANSFFTLERAFTWNDHTHNAISNASLCATAAENPRKDSLSLSLSLSRKGDVFFPSFGCSLALSRSLSRTFSSVSKKFYHTRALFCSLSHTHANSFAKMTMIYTTALLFAHSSELFVRTRKKESAKSTGRFNFCLKTPNRWSKG